ncbi:hypothetical protein AB7179_02140 [Providencia manganoxydans]|uniref:hypothetical protein n=1 Tax=Providencia manganoxydans TaxID=2923283 RepID=UPI002853B82E|nr:hypothetical protein [Providencia manganoxydans]MDX4945050.1 hypothetical protein [Providencia manganoxydans]HEF8774918.1 hypothetical protein [Providencia stuartii]
MKYLKPLFIAASVFAVSFSSFAYHGNNNCDGTWHRGGYQNNAQSYDNRPCNDSRHYNASGRHYGMHNGAMQYSTSLQTAQPDEALKKIALDAPKAESGKQYVVHVSVIEITGNNTLPQNQ